MFIGTHLHTDCCMLAVAIPFISKSKHFDYFFDFLKVFSWYWMHFYELLPYEQFIVVIWIITISFKICVFKTEYCLTLKMPTFLLPTSYFKNAYARRGQNNFYSKERFIYLHVFVYSLSKNPSDVCFLKNSHLIGFGSVETMDIISNSITL